MHAVEQTIKTMRLREQAQVVGTWGCKRPPWGVV